MTEPDPELEQEQWEMAQAWAESIEDENEIREMERTIPDPEPPSIDDPWYFGIRSDW